MTGGRLAIACQAVRCTDVLLVVVLPVFFVDPLATFCGDALRVVCLFAVGFVEAPVWRRLR